MPFCLSVMTEKLVTSEPVPEVVGMATSLAFWPSFGNLNARLRTSKNFSRMSEIVGRGESAAHGMTQQLRALSVSPEEYEEYLRGKLDRRAQLSGQPAYYLDKIVIHNNSRLSDEVIKGMLQVETGKVQTNENLEAGIERINALGTFERVTYQIDEELGQNVLVVNANEKGWGPNYLDFTFAI